MVSKELSWAGFGDGFFFFFLFLLLLFVWGFSPLMLQIFLLTSDRKLYATVHKTKLAAVVRKACFLTIDIRTRIALIPGMKQSKDVHI